MLAQGRVQTIWQQVPNGSAPHLKTVSVFYTAAVSSKWKIHSFPWIKSPTTKSRLKGDYTSLLWKVWDWEIIKPPPELLKHEQFQKQCVTTVCKGEKPFVSFAQRLQHRCTLTSETNTARYLKGNCHAGANAGETDKRWNKAKILEDVVCKVIKHEDRFYFLHYFLNTKTAGYQNLDRLIILVCQFVRKARI